MQTYPDLLPPARCLFLFMTMVLHPQSCVDKLRAAPLYALLSSCELPHCSTHSDHYVIFDKAAECAAAALREKSDAGVLSDLRVDIAGHDIMSAVDKDLD